MKSDLHSIPIDLLPINIALYRASGDGDFIFIDLNTMAQETEKISKEELLGRKVTEVFPGIKEMGLFDVFKRVYESGKSEVFEIAHYNDERISGWRKNTVTKVDENTIMAAYEDADILKELESQVEEKTKEQSLLLSLFDKGDTVLFKWNCDENWSIDNVSLSVEALLGYSRDDMILSKIDYASLVHQDDIQRVQDEVSDAMESNVEFFKHEPYRIVIKDGSIKWVLDYTIVVRDKNNNITHFIGAISDITELKQQEKLIQQQSRLAQMGEMISMIAHQWRQPLSIISLNVSNIEILIKLKEKLNDDKMLGCINSVSEQCEYLSQTIDDFRNFYKPNKKLVTVKLEELISKSLNIIKKALINDNIEIIKEYNSNEEIELYESEMMQAVLNILKNAQDNFKEKDIKDPCIKITTENRTISISDNGGGIPENIIDKIFDPYFSTKDEKNGTGLGLYMSKIIVEDHHYGVLSVKNRDDGVCFTIEFGVLS